MSILSAKHFHDEAAAIKFVEARVWPNGKPVCPKCGVVDDAGELKGKSTRLGVWKCYACRKPFTVKVGTIFEDSHVALNLWLQAIALIAASKKGISSNQLHRVLGVTLKSAWFMSHRIPSAAANIFCSFDALSSRASITGSGGFGTGFIDSSSATIARQLLVMGLYSVVWYLRASRF